MEFKRLCDSVRGYLQTLIKTEKKQFFQNKVQISRPEVLKILIQIRINLLDTATELEQWQEAFKTAEDIIFLMDKFEKQSDDGTGKKFEGKSKKVGKIPPIMKLEFYANIEKLLWISDYHLYHAHATILIKELAVKVQKWLASSKNVDKLRDAKAKLERYDIENANNKIVLATLVTPFKNLYTNYLTVGDELFEHEKDMETQTCSRMMGILKLNVVPSRKNLMNLIENNKILDNCDAKIKNLFELIENEKNPLVIGKKGAEILNYLRSNERYEKFANLISKNLILKSLILMAKLYDSISYKRLLNILPWTTTEELEEIISENSRVKVISCTIDHSKNIIKFNNNENIKNSLNNTLQKFLTSVEKISSEIIQTNSKNLKKFNVMREALYKQIHLHNTNSLVIYDALINGMELTTEKLEKYIKEKELFKEETKEKQIKEKKEEKEKAEEDARLMRELLKDEQKKKEFDIQLKKYLIDRIRVYTNVLFIDGKKVKLDDISKDLSKYTDEQLIKLLEKEEYEFKTKKEKRFKQIAKDTDYIIREFRRRDYEILSKNVQEEERNYNETLEKEEKRSYDEKIGQKANLLRIKSYKEKFFQGIQTQRESEYKEKMGEFTQALEKKVREDLLKDIKPYFKSYIDDFRKKEEESAAKSAQSSGWKVPTRDFIKKGENYKPTDRTKYPTTTGPAEFARSSKATAVPEQPRTIEKGNEFKKGERFVTAVTEITPPKVEFAKGSNVLPKDEKKETPIIKKGEKIETTPTVEFAKGSNVQKEDKKDVVIKKSEKIETSTTTTEFARGSNVKPAEKKETVVIKRGENVLPAKEEKKTTDTGFKRGENLQPAKEEKKTTDTGFKRGENAQPAKEDKKITDTGFKRGEAAKNTETKSSTSTTTTAKKTDGWRK